MIEKCYWPLLELVDAHGLPLGIEMSGWTLEQIQTIAPQWVERFKILLEQGACELIGSGYVQMIGPLVPYELNLRNQQFGLYVYRSVLGVEPRLALVNEMAYSSGMVDVYQKSGYQGIIMDRDNVSLALGFDSDAAVMPSYARGTKGGVMPVLWSDSILFQKFQRYAHGDIRLDDYLAYFRNRAVELKLPLALYANDAEIFDFRPGRYETESGLHAEGEWLRIEQLVARLKQEGAEWLSPSQALARSCENKPMEAVQLTSVKQPVPVKKQAKYNLSRWAVTGRDDLWLNTMCHRIYQALQRSGFDNNPDLQRRLCQCWASDMRTHITDQRWDSLLEALDSLAVEVGVELGYSEHGQQISKDSTEQELLDAGYSISFDEDGFLLSIQTESLQLVLNLRRGLTVHSLAFRDHGYLPVVGTLPQGYFHSIELGADFYSAGVVVEQVTKHRRLTDLEWVEPKISVVDGDLHIKAIVETTLGQIHKELVIDSNTQRLAVNIAFPGWLRPYGTVRAGTLTMLPEAFNDSLSVSYHAGGEGEELLELNDGCDHHQPASSLVSCKSGLGATSGCVKIGDGEKGVSIHWDTTEAAIFPMLQHQPCQTESLTRLFFSLCEIDETYRQGGELPSLRYQISPH